ncbi:hypothetical protein AVEN_266236-1, partial [Araneus ventricosus]
VPSRPNGCSWRSSRSHSSIFLRPQYLNQRSNMVLVVAVRTLKGSNPFSGSRPWSLRLLLISVSNGSRYPAPPPRCDLTERFI